MKFDINAIARTVASKMMNDVEANTADYAEQFDKGDLIERNLEETLEDMPSLNFEAIYLMVENHPEITLALHTASFTIKDWISDQEIWGDGSYAAQQKAVGISNKDFI